MGDVYVHRLLPRTCHVTRLFLLQAPLQPLFVLAAGKSGEHSRNQPSSVCWENIPRAISLKELVVRKHHHGTILGAAELTSEAVRVS
jgi:hypothetical protein